MAILNANYKVYNSGTSSFDTINFTTTALNVSIADAGGIITATNVEGALQEIEEEINSLSTSVTSHSADDMKHIDYAVAGGTNAYTTTIANITVLTEGLSVKIKFTNANTGAGTLNINSLGVKTIQKGNGNGLSSGNIKAGQICHLVYTGSVFQLLGEGGEYGTASASDVKSTKTVGTENGVIQGTLDLSLLTENNLKEGVTIDGITGVVVEDSVKTFVVGDTPIAISAAEVINNSSSYIKLKEIMVNRSGNIRVKFDGKTDSTNPNGHTRIYKNGQPIGTERTYYSTTYTTFTEDIVGVNKGDLIQLYGWLEGSVSYHNILRNFTISIGNQLPYGTLNL